MAGFQVDVLTWGVGWDWGAESGFCCGDGDVEECTVCTCYGRDGGGLWWGCGVYFPGGDVKEVEDKGLEDVFPGVRDVGGYGGHEEEGEKGVGDVECFVVCSFAEGWEGGDGQGGEHSNGEDAKLDVAIVKATGEGGDGVEEAQVEDCVGEEEKVDYSAGEAVVGVECFMGEVCGQLDGRER